MASSSHPREGTSIETVVLGAPSLTLPREKKETSLLTGLFFSVSLQNQPVFKIHKIHAF